MSEKTKIEFNPVESAKEGVANLALSTMALAAAAGLFPHMGERQAVLASSGSNTSIEDQSNFIREKDEFHQQVVCEATQQVPGRSKDV